jgi:hypothetical protein
MQGLLVEARSVAEAAVLAGRMFGRSVAEAAHHVCSAVVAPTTQRAAPVVALAQRLWRMAAAASVRGAADG